MTGPSQRGRPAVRGASAVPGISPLRGSIRRYAWGDPGRLARFLRAGDHADPDPDDLPAAELWLGTHPTAPSTVEFASPEGGRRPLVAVTGPLPYLLKVLAIGAPLSLQVHPRHRLDGERPKAEALIALEATRALAGLRPAVDTLEAVGGLRSPVLDRWVAPLRRRPVSGPAAVLASTLRLGREAARPLVDAAVAAAGAIASDAPGPARRAADLVGRLVTAHQGDPGIMAALLLHDLDLGPGDALFLPPGVPHAYLGGLAIEVMTASDAVVRGGLTVKPVHIDAFLAAIRSRPGPAPRLAATPVVGGSRYAPPTASFELLDLEVDGVAVPSVRAPALALAVEGRVELLDRDATRTLERGASAVVMTDRLRLAGRGRVVLAQVSSPA